LALAALPVAACLPITALREVLLTRDVADFEGMETFKLAWRSTAKIGSNDPSGWRSNQLGIK
jgi:hypothetical protein